jgi:hypothetical protein
MFLGVSDRGRITLDETVRLAERFRLDHRRRRNFRWHDRR